MRLLFVGTNRGGGGTESHFITLASSMAAAGHEIHAAVWPDEFIHRALAADGRVRLHPARLQKKHDARGTLDLVRLCRAVRPDWMIGTFKKEYYPIALVGRALQVPVVLFNHLDQRFHPVMIRALPPLVERILVPSEYLRTRLAERGIPCTRTAVLHNPVDTTHYHVDPAARADMRARLGFGPDDVVIGYVGRFEPQKGVLPLATALDAAMDRCGALRALWVGHGESEPQLRALVDASAHAPRHVWQHWSADVFPFYVAMDALALPSVGPETFGRVLVEAAACGLPGLGSRLGGIPETMEDGRTGLLLPPGDIPAWTEGILTVAASGAARASMGAAARDFVSRQFDAPRIAETFARMLATRDWGSGADE